MKLTVSILLALCALAVAPEPELGVLILSPEPQPKLHHLLQPNYQEGPALYLAAELAADIVNNSSSILQGYRLKLLREDSGCNVPFRAVNSFVQPLLSSRHRSDTGESAVPIVGVIGPACSRASLSVSALSSRTELALINIHSSGTHLLNDREDYQYAFGVIDSGELIAEAMVSLLQTAGWSTIAVFYDLSRVYYSSLAQAFSNHSSVKSEMHSLVGISGTNFSPFHQIQNEFRIVFLLMNTNLLSRMLCIAYHSGYFPSVYQYVLSVDSPADIDAVEFISDSRVYNCSRNNIGQILNGAILIRHQLERPDTNSITLSGLSLQSFRKLYRERLEPKGLTESIFAITYFDAAWSFFMALNASYDLVDLTGYGFGQPNVTNLIREKLFELNYEGLVGKVQFSRINGRNKQNATIFTLDEEGNCTLFAYYNSDQDNITLITNMEYMYVADTFEMDIATVPKPLLWTMVVLVFLGFLLTLLLNILTCVHRNTKSVKASSVRLSQVAFVGCYIHAVSMIFVVLVYGFSDVINSNSICTIQQLLDFSISLGLTILFAAICVRLWRLYRIFIRFRNPGNYLSDYFLSVIIAIMVVLNIIITIPPFFVNKYSPKFELYPNNASITSIPAVLRCEQKENLLWILLGLLVSALLLLAILVFAILTRKVPLKNFRTKSIILMSYTLAGIIPFIIALYILFGSLREKDSEVRFMIIRFCATVILLLWLIFIPCAMLFFPPLLPVVKDMKNKYFCVKVDFKPVHVNH